MTRNNAHAQVEDAEAQARAAGTLSEICIKNAGIKTKIANSGAFLGLSKLVGTNGSSSYDIVLQRLAGEFLSPAFCFCESLFAPSFNGRAPRDLLPCHHHH